MTTIPEGAPPLDALRDMIGLRVLHGGRTCEVIEVLEEGPALVLQCCDQDSVIQADQYGEAHRRAPETHVVSVLDPRRAGPAPEFLALQVLGPIAR
jgi:hypothetical protein